MTKERRGGRREGMEKDGETERGKMEERERGEMEERERGEMEE